MKTEDILTLAVESGVIRVSQVMNIDLQDSLVIFAGLIRDAAPAPKPEPFWHAVVSESAPVIDKAIRREDVADEYAGKCREQWPEVRDIEVVPLYRQIPSPSAGDAVPQPAIADLQALLDPVYTALRERDCTGAALAMERVLRWAEQSAGSASPSVAHWTSVHDRLPAAETDVLVRGIKRDSSVFHDVAGMFHGEWLSQVTEREMRGEVTHWQPLPAAPEHLE